MDYCFVKLIRKALELG